MGRAVPLARRWGPASAAAAAINAALLASLILTEPKARPVVEPSFQVSILPLRHTHSDTHHDRSARTRTLVPRAAERPVHASPPPPAPPLPSPPQRWRVDIGAPGAVRDLPSLQKSILDRDACAKGELWKLSTEGKAKCLARWDRFRPTGEARLRAPQLRDPHGEFARAAAAAEDKRHPFSGAPIGACEPSATGSNFGVGCPSGEKGSLVKRLEGDPPR